MFNIIYLTVMLCSVCSLFERCESKNSTYGSFKVITENVEHCPYTRNVDVGNTCDYNVKVSEDKLVGYAVVPNDVINTQAKFIMYKLAGNTQKKLFNITVDHPCENRVFYKIATALLKFNKSTCKVQKGNYTLDGVDSNQLFHSVVGKNYFYMTVKGTLEWFSASGSVCCIGITYKITP